MIYLDHAASTPMKKETLDCLQRSFAEDYANPSSSHRLGKGLQQRIEACRQNFLQQLNGENGDLFLFLSSATEANNMVIRSFVGREALYSLADHPSVTAPCQKLLPGRAHTYALETRGCVDFDLLGAQLSTADLLVLSHVNNISGTLLPLQRVVDFVREKNPSLHIHLDASQSFGKVPLSVEALAVDSIAVSAHKMGGPRGIAGLFLRRNTEIQPLLLGGGQEMDLRSSTQVAPLIFAWAESLCGVRGQMELEMQKVQRLHESLREQLSVHAPEIEFPFSANWDAMSPYIALLITPKISSDIILRHLEEKRIYISSSSACSSRVKGVNPVFSALGIPPQQHKNVLRVSFSAESTQSEVDTFVRELSETYRELRRFL